MRLSATSTRDAPWYVIPANHKWFRNLAVSQIVADTMEELDMSFPHRPSILPRSGENIMRRSARKTGPGGETDRPREKPVKHMDFQVDNSIRWSQILWFLCRNFSKKFLCFFGIML